LYSKELNDINYKQNNFENLTIQLNDIIELIQEGEEFYSYISDELKSLTVLIDLFYKKIFFKHKNDKNKCYLTLKAGVGGLESMDFTNMLLKMYLKYLEDQKIKHEVIDINYGDQQLINNVTILIDMPYGYAYFKKESGIHRLTRVSPFGNGKLHTSFLEVQVLPIITKTSFEILKKDLRIDTYRGSGPGGQHKNKTDSAVRIVHLPTGITTTCEGQRSQHANKDTAMIKLYSELELMYLKKDNEENDVFKNKQTSQWGSQIRSYLFNNNLVKDHITNKEYNINDFLNGNIGSNLKLKITS
jgi:peptide chain release factor 2